MSPTHGPPTVLFDYALAALQYDLEHLETLTPPEITIQYTYDLVCRSAGFFDEKDVKVLISQHTLGQLIPGNSRWERSTADGSAKSDGVWFEGPFAYLIFQLTNEPGLGGDPFLQTLAAYGEIIQQKEVSLLSLSLSPVCSSSTESPQTVLQILFTVKSTRHSVVHSGGPPRRLNCHFY